jgi:hypothetical protein
MMEHDSAGCDGGCVRRRTFTNRRNMRMKHDNNKEEQEEGGLGVGEVLDEWEIQPSKRQWKL